MFHETTINPFGAKASTKANAGTLVATTGGTIDSTWDANKDTAVPASRSIIPEYLRDAVRSLAPLRVSEICSKDSRGLTRSDRENVVDEVVGAMERAAIVTIGTYGMPDVAMQLADSDGFAKAKKKVIFTGALVPIRGFANSDGGFNLGVSLALLDHLEVGKVAVCMNGQLIEAGHVMKDLEATRFYPSNKKFVLCAGFEAFSVVTTGGTMDFQLDNIDGLKPRERSAVPDFLRTLDLSQKVTHRTCTRLLDSREIEANQMEEIVELVAEAPNDRVLVTAGIYGLPRIKEALEKAGVGKNKRVVLTGSRMPLTGIVENDAPFQLGYAVGALADDKPGIFIALSGSILAANENPMALFTTEEQAAIARQNTRTRR